MGQFLRQFSLFCILLVTSQVSAGQGIVHAVEHGRPSPTHQRRFHTVNLDRHGVDVLVANGIARTTVTQVFRNPNKFILEGTYVFPVPEGASLTDFTMVMNGKVIHGEVLEREKARRIYEGIVREARDPALLEYIGRRMFRARVYPLPPEGTAEITLSYVEQLSVEGGIGEYRYPLKTQAFSRSPVKNISVRAVIQSGTAIKTVFSSSHSVEKIRKSDNEVVASFEGKQVLAGKDFHLLYTLSDREFGLHLLSSHGSRDGGFFVMNISPRQAAGALKVAPKDVVFVVDTSGSMREDGKMGQAREALKYGLRGLNEHDRFNIVGFSTEARRYADSMLEVSKASIAEAAVWVDGLKANGGTNIHDALVEALEPLDGGDRVRLIVFLTDGRPTVGETRTKKILAAAHKANSGSARLFSFGVGYDVNADLLDLLASQNRGTQDYVTSSQNIELKLSTFFDKVSNPVLSDLEFSLEGAEVLEMYPKELSDLFKGTELTVMGRYKSGGGVTVTLKGSVGSEKKTFVYEGKFAQDKKGHDFVPLLWARRKVGFLMDQVRLNGGNKELQDEIVRLGTKYGLATPYTSFLVTEDATAESDRPGQGGRHGRSGQTYGFNNSSKDAIGLGGGAGGVKPRASGGINAQRRSRATAPPVANAVTRSLEAKGLKEAALDEVADKEPEQATDVVKRVQGRTFYRVNGRWIDAALRSMTKAELKGKTEVVKAFSDRYFELLREIPGLSGFLAAFPELLIQIDGRILEISAPKKEDPGTGVPTGNQQEKN